MNYQIRIEYIKGRQVLDSRGNPTVEAEVGLSDGTIERAISPSGASTGSKEAVELRDGDKKNYLGKGVEKAVENINTIIADELINVSPFNQREIDNILIELDGTKNKSNLGANAILAVSLAVAKSAAKSIGMPLFRYFGGVISNILPVPMMNIINGGEHAMNGLNIQEFMIMPISAKNFAEGLRVGSEIFHTLKKLLAKDGHSTNVGDEGGFAPNFNKTEDALSYIVRSINEAGYKIGEDIVIALDSAASEFYKDGKYNIDGEEKTSSDMIEFYENLIEKYSIFSIEDALDENDHDGFIELTKKLGSKIQIVGDDLFCTNVEILKDGIEKKMANALLVKLNQIGTLTETLEAIQMAHRAGYNCIISHRSGESEDTTIAHLAVATNAGQIKTGSLCRTDRIAKYNELLRIEDELDDISSYAGKDILKKIS